MVLTAVPCDLNSTGRVYWKISSPRIRLTMPTLAAGWNSVPRWRTIMFPGMQRCPPYNLTPRNLGLESLVFWVLPPCFLEAHRSCRCCQAAAAGATSELAPEVLAVAPEDAQNRQKNTLGAYGRKQEGERGAGAASETFSPSAERATATKPCPSCLRVPSTAVRMLYFKTDGR